LSPSSFRSLGRVSVNRSKTCTFCDCDDVVAEGAPQRLLTVCANGRLTRSVNMDSKDGRAADGGGSLSLARAKASVTPAVSGGGIGAGGTGAAADATRTVRSAGTPFTVGTLTVTGGGKGGAPADCATPSVSAVPRCANAISRAESNSRVNLRPRRRCGRGRPSRKKSCGWRQPRAETWPPHFCADILMRRL
jgi:hypothetical protein